MLDPCARLRKNRHVFTDGAARTLVVTSKENAPAHPVAGPLPVGMQDPRARPVAAIDGGDAAPDDPVRDGDELLFHNHGCALYPIHNHG